MTNSEPFNENDLNSITTAEYKILYMTQINVDADFINKCIEKALKCLKTMNKDDYTKRNTEGLLRVLMNCTLKISQFLYSNETIKWILNMNMHETLKNILNFYIAAKDVQNRKYLMKLIF